MSIVIIFFIIVNYIPFSTKYQYYTLEREKRE